MEKHKILVADAISETGIELLSQDPQLEVDVRIGLSEDELVSIAGEYSGIIVRSSAQITGRVIEAAPKLKCVGRAGVGVDNIDREVATQRGVVVMNTPTGNTISTAEHAFSLMMSMARNIAHAHAGIVEGRWSREKGKYKKLFQGVELYKKTLAVVGMGRIGSEFARRAMAFGMRVVVYDPFLTANRARTMRVELQEDLDEVVKEADFITLHMPLTSQTKHIINRERIAMMKPTTRIINCARGGLIDEDALYDALTEGRLAGAALDVFEDEPPAEDCKFFSLSNVTLTPHLGASTQEAQENVGIEIAQSIRNFLVDGAIVNAINMPNVDEATMSAIGPHLIFGEVLGRLLAQISPKHATFLRANYSGRVSDFDTTLVTRFILKGFLESSSGESVNHINGPAFAENLGLRLTESKLTNPTDYQELIEVVCGNEEQKQEISVSGTFFGGQPRIVKLRGRHMDLQVGSHVLLLEHKDVPGIVGRVGTILGKHAMNIANMSVGRDEAGGHAMTLVNLDSAPAQECLKELEGGDILEARYLKL